jgi:site-specific DNA-methyltransferase (adenine-specific)
MELNIIKKGDCVTLMKDIESESVDCILTDPSYLYLKNQKLDRQFDENGFFEESKRVLKKHGFIVLFGRGASFYRWNTKLDDLGFKFKEEIIWNKRRVSSPCSPLARVHETVSIWSRCGKINCSIVNYGEAKAYRLDKITNDLKRLGSVMNMGKEFEKITKNLELKNQGIKPDIQVKQNLYKTTLTSPIIKGDVNTKVLWAMQNGAREQSIIDELRNLGKEIHPTQKPVRLLERLLSLVTKEGDTVLDGFAGSGSTAVACINSNRKFICYEIDDEYYSLAKNRIETALTEKNTKCQELDFLNEFDENGKSSTSKQEALY